MSGDADRDRYSRIADLFHRALDLSAPERTAFLLTLRTDEPTLASEVEALVAAHGRAADFIEQPAFESAQAHAPTRAPVVIPRDPIGHYRVLSVIGEGGMGIVYLAEDTRLGRTVALKAVRTQFGGDATRTARLRREARAAATLTHPNIATVYALEDIDGRLYIASEYVPGDTLRDELTLGPLAPARVRDVVLAITRALTVAHERGVVHRDLKPENVVCTPSGGVKILDFGLAQFADPGGDDGSLTQDGAVFGTPAYMSPEQIRGGIVDARSDLFAVGVIVYELLTGLHPFTGRTSAATIARVLEESPVPMRGILPQGALGDPGVDVLQAIVSGCLQKAAASRPQSAAEVVAMLEGAVSFPAGAEAPASAGTGDSDARQNVGQGFSPRGRDVHPQSTWWWQFHQGAATVAYFLLLYPLWSARDLTAGIAGTTFFLAGLVAAVVAGMLRLHLWFALRQYPSEWDEGRTLAKRVIRVADVVFALVLASRGLTAIRLDDPSAVLLVAAAASVTVSFAIIEPATTRAMRG